MQQPIGTDFLPLSPTDIVWMIIVIGLLVYLPMRFSFWRISRAIKQEQDRVLFYLPKQEREDARAELSALASAIWAVKIFQRRPPESSFRGFGHEDWREEPTVLSLLAKHKDCPKYQAFEIALVAYLNDKWVERDKLRGKPGGGHDIIYDHG